MRLGAALLALVLIGCGERTVPLPPATPLQFTPTYRSEPDEFGVVCYYSGTLACVQVVRP